MGGDLEAKRNRWRLKLQEFQTELWTDPPHPTHIYHYSTLKGIEGILSSREIWLSDIGMMDDKHDGTYWVAVFRDILNRKSVPPAIKRAFQRGDGIGLGSAYYTYLACFSPKSELEDQWQRYADRGTGCAIELPFDVVKANSEGGNAYAWTPMLYDRNEQNLKAEKTIDYALGLCRAGNMTSEERKDYWTYAAFSFLLCGTRFKHPRFCREQEWRIFRSRPDRDGAKYRTGANNQQIPYLSLELKPEMVTGLIKGNACSSPDADLIALLNAAGYPASLRTNAGAKANSR